MNLFYNLLHFPFFPFVGAGDFDFPGGGDGGFPLGEPGFPLGDPGLGEGDFSGAFAPFFPFLSSFSIWGGTSSSTFSGSGGLAPFFAGE